MKKFNPLYILTAISALFFIPAFAATDTATYIENHYGAPIKYKIGPKNSTNPEISVANQNRSFLGKASDLSTLSIRTTGTGSTFLSPFTEITQAFTEIKNNPRDGNMNAIILIKPSRSYQNWDISINWENTDQETTAFTDIEYDLHMILNGSLGKDYAEKARAINDYDYTKSSKAGFINLKESLLKKITEANTQTYKKVTRKKGVWVAPDLATAQDLRDSIDTLYRALQKYKARDNQ